MSISTLTRTLLLDLEIPGNPVPKGRPRVRASEQLVNGIPQLVTRTQTPKRTAAAESRLAWTVKEALVGRGGPDDALYAIDVRFYEDVRSGWEADTDNCQKLIGDALNGIVWLDDRQVVEWYASIERGASRPRTELRIYRLEGEG